MKTSQKTIDLSKEIAETFSLTLKLSEPFYNTETKQYDYKATLKRTTNNTSFTVDYHTGAGWIDGSSIVRPRLADILSSLVLDSGASDMTFQDFCGDFGYDYDSRKAEEIYYLCVEIGNKVKKMMGQDFELLASMVQDY